MSCHVMQQGIATDIKTPACRISNRQKEGDDFKLDMSLWAVSGPSELQCDADQAADARAITQKIRRLPRGLLANATVTFSLA